MKQFGFINVAAAIPAVKVANCSYNLQQVILQTENAIAQDIELLVFPELSVTGYTCQDLFRHHTLINQAEYAVKTLLETTKNQDITLVVGVPMTIMGKLYNCALVIQSGKIQGVVVKTYLPNYNEFYEQRWFFSSQHLSHTTLNYAGQEVEVGKALQLFQTQRGINFAIEICEDLWAPIPPSSYLATQGADLILNLSASNELIGKHQYLTSLLSQQSARTLSGYIYCSSGFGESTQDVVYGGNALIYENGQCLARSERFSYEPQLITAQIDVELLRSERQNNTSFKSYTTEGNLQIRTLQSFENKDFVLKRHYNAHPFIPSLEQRNESCEEIFNIQVSGLAKRMVHTHCQTAVIGISGGMDSTLALLVCVRCFDKLKIDRSHIIGVTMPGFGTTDRTYHNAISLMKNLGVTIREISIVDSVNQHFKDIDHNPELHDVVYENSQARERTQLLMDIANQTNGLVIGTGDLSELALGWCTYNGDHISMYAVNVSIPKTLIRYMLQFVADKIITGEASITLHDIIETPISPELIPADEHGQIVQKTEDLVGPYELHDFFLYHFLRFGFSPDKLLLLAKQAFCTGVEDVNRYDEATIKHWLRTFIKRFFSQQFKRSCLPDGPKVGSVSLSPRGDWRMPSDACAEDWLQTLEENA